MWRFFTALSFIVFLFPQSVFAHAFGQQYNLPVPVWLYLYGGGAVIFCSFLVIAFVFKIGKPEQLSLQTKELTFYKFFRFFSHPLFVGILKIISVVLFLLTLVSGLVGKNVAADNFNMNFFWIIFLLGFSYFSILFGNIWDFLNPLKIIIESIETVVKKQFKGFFVYPQKMGVYPALFFYFLLLWHELILKVSPLELSTLLLEYAFLTFVGVLFWGKQTWFNCFDFFSVFFRIISLCSPFEYREGKIFLRFPFLYLLKEKTESMSFVLFILFMLSSTAFDGFSETGIWYQLYFEYLYPLGAYFGIGDIQVIQTLVLLLSPFLFFIIYLFFIALVKLFVRSEMSLSKLAKEFALTLVPIALAYHVAHYYTLLLVQGQDIFRLISDPFVFGWNIFGTSDFKPNIAIVEAGFVWHSQVALIVIGHIVAIYLSHLKAVELFKTQKKATLSQIPMLFLMVFYTVFGLWILSLPLSAGS